MSNNSQLLVLSETAVGLEEITRQRKMIEGVMSSVMKEDIHYGKIPGSKQPSLLKPGAQLLCQLFRLRAEYDVTEVDLEKGHKRFKVKASLFLLGTEPPVKISEGWGEATTMESKHRFRIDGSAGVEVTEEPIPGMYWSIKKKDGWQSANDWLSTAFEGKRVKPVRGGNGNWVVGIVSGDTAKKVENDNIADVWNTVLKMGCKRAYVEATITATASNDFFTQDLEDIKANLEAFRAENPESDPDADGDETEGAEPGNGKTMKKAKAREVKSGSWKTVINHIGKRDGPIGGKPLGALDNGQRAWLLREITEKEEGRRSKADKTLLAALLLWQQEQAQPKGGKAAGPGEGNEGVNLQVLSENLEWAEVDTETFLRVANREKWTAATAFDKITDGEATAMVSMIETVLEKCKAEKHAPAK